MSKSTANKTSAALLVDRWTLDDEQDVPIRIEGYGLNVAAVLSMFPDETQTKAQAATVQV